MNRLNETRKGIWYRCMLATLFVSLPLLIAAETLTADKKKDYVIGIFFDNTVGGSSAQWLDMSNSLLRMGVEESGVPAQIQKFPTEDAALNAFLGGKIEGVRLWPQRMIMIQEKKIDVYPWVTYTIDRKRKTAFCFWNAKTAAIKDVSALVGKTIVRDEFTPLDLIMMREFLAVRGLDKPLWKVFKSFVIVPGANSAFMCVAMGKADVTWDRYDWKPILKIMIPGAASKLSPGFCSDESYARWAIVFNRKLVDKDDIRKMRDVIGASNATLDSYAKKDPGIMQLLQFMKMAKAKVIPADDSEVDHELEVYRKAKTNGWLAETDVIISQMKKAGKGKPVSIRADYDFCRKTCKPGKDQLACIDACMK